MKYTKYYFNNNLFLEGAEIYLEGFKEKYLPSSACLRKVNISMPKENLRELFINDFHNSINKEFTSDAPNIINFLYYSYPKLAYNPENGLATIYNVCEPLIEGIANLFCKLNNYKDTLKVKEVCFGNKWNAWQIIANKLNNTNILLTASDLDNPLKLLPDTFNIPKNLTVSGEPLNLLEKIDPIDNQNDKFDIIFTSYAFASIWFPDDLHLIKNTQNKWFQVKMRPKLSENQNGYENLLKQFRNNKLDNPDAKDFGLTVLEESIAEFDLKSMKYSEIIEDEYGNDNKETIMNYPGGLISKVQELLPQVNKGGAIVIGDVAYHGDNPNVPITTTEFSGRVARYKVENYVIAKKILTILGYKAEIIPFKKLAADYLNTGWENDSHLRDVKLLNNNPNNCILIVFNNSNN